VPALTLLFLAEIALPMIALLVTFLFLTVEVWETAGTLGGPAHLPAVALFSFVSVLLLVAARFSQGVQIAIVNLLGASATISPT
jgi:hypothetical protein